MSNLLQLEDVNTYIAGFHILQGISIEVPKEGVTVLLGRNGAGKTTTLRTILGFNPPNSGQVKFEEEVINGWQPYRIAGLGIGYVPEDRGIFGTLSVYDNLKVAARDGVREMESRLETVYDLFPDLKRAVRQQAGTLSGGQQQMLALARILVSKNRLLIIDEPSSGLAPIVVDRVAEALSELKKTLPILLVEQNYNMARQIADRYYIIDEGRCVHQGQMEDLDNEPELKQRYLGVAV